MSYDVEYGGRNIGKTSKAVLVASDTPPKVVYEIEKGAACPDLPVKNVDTCDVNIGRIRSVQIERTVRDTLSFTKTIYDWAGKAEARRYDILAAEEQQFLEANPGFVFVASNKTKGKYGEMHVTMVYKRKNDE